MSKRVGLLVRAGRGWPVTARDEHDRALRERRRRGSSTSSSAIRAVNGVIGSKRSDLLDRRGAPAPGRSASSCPLLRVLGEQPQRVGELALRRVDAADEHVEHEVDELDVGEPVAVLLGGDQRRDQVLARALRGGARAARPQYA